MRRRTNSHSACGEVYIAIAVTQTVLLFGFVYVPLFKMQCVAVLNTVNIQMPMHFLVHRKLCMCVHSSGVHGSIVRSIPSDLSSVT